MLVCKQIEYQMSRQIKTVREWKSDKLKQFEVVGMSDTTPPILHRIKDGVDFEIFERWPVERFVNENLSNGLGFVIVDYFSDSIHVEYEVVDPIGIPVKSGKIEINDIHFLSQGIRKVVLDF